MNTKVHLFISFMSKLAICTMIFCYSLTMAFAGESLAQRKRLVETHVDVRQNHEELQEVPTPSRGSEPRMGTKAERSLH